MGKPPPPPRKLARDQQGRPIVPALWLGPAHGPERAVCVLYACPWCGAESIIKPDAWVIRQDWLIRSGRDERGRVFVRTEWHVQEWGAIAPCLGCGIEFALRVLGRLFEPWRLGTGLVKPLPPDSYVVDAEAEGGQR